MHPERDIQSVRFVGTLSLALGGVLLILTLLAALFALFSFGGATNASLALHWVVGFVIALIMSSTMMACGAQLQRARHYGWSDVENIRMVWTALVIVVTLSSVASHYFVPPLVYLGALILVALFAVRGAIIRLSGR